MLNVSIQVGFECETREEIDEVLTGINAPDGSTVVVNVSETEQMSAPPGGGHVDLPPQAMTRPPRPNA
jgi:hypothetical protein